MQNIFTQNFKIVRVYLFREFQSGVELWRRDIIVAPDMGSFYFIRYIVTGAIDDEQMPDIADGESNCGSVILRQQ